MLKKKFFSFDENFIKKNAQKIRENVAVDKKKCLRNI